MDQSSSHKPLRVFISYAAKDTDWKAERVEDVASALEAAGLEIWLDLWYSRQIQVGQTIHDWRMWINEAILGADYVVCLTSPRYRALWGPGFGRKAPWRKKVQGKILVAEESMRLLQKIFNGRRRSPGYICTLRLSDRDEEVIPNVLFPGFPAYRWVSDREEFVSHFGAAPSGTTTTDPAFAHAARDVAKAAARLLPELAAPIEPSAGIGSVAEMQPQQGPSVQSRKVFISPFRGPSIWPAEDAWRAPIGDFPPPWASAWGDDPYGLWADLTVNGVTQRMRWVEPSGPDGFWMGDDQTGRRREVVKEGFWLADTPCTQAFWTAVVGDNPSHFKQGADAPQRPVESVSWDDVMNQFIPRLAERQAWGKGEGPCLPSEVEWEYAARAGTRTAYWWGDAWDATRGNVDVTGNRQLSDREGTTPVHLYSPNPWGLYDVHGNVWEWCVDAWRPRLDAPEARPDEEYPVVRGGSWIGRPGLARAACRDGWHRRDAGRHFGFRFALRSRAGPEAR